jgi:hypothetical protein
VVRYHAEVIDIVRRWLDEHDRPVVIAGNKQKYKVVYN